MIQQWIQGQSQASESPRGADFALSVQAIRGAGVFFAEYRKTPFAKRQAALVRFRELFAEQQPQLRENLITHLGFPSISADKEIAAAESILAELEAVAHEASKQAVLGLPVGPCLLHVGWSSPLIRFVSHALPALVLGNTIVLVSDPVAQPLYTRLSELATTAGFPASAVSSLATSDTESLETLYSHPIFRAVRFSGHAYEGEFLRAQPRQWRQRLKADFGGRNPVVFMHDAGLEMIPELVARAVDYHYLPESRFNRWFVQEKNFSGVSEAIAKALSDLGTDIVGRPPGPDFEARFAAQAPRLAKEKNWRMFPFAVNASLDFNNCSPWQQSEVLGPVLTVTRFKNSAEAVKFCNTTFYANAAAVISSSAERAQEVAKQLQMPNLFLNRIGDVFPHAATHASLESGVGTEVTDWNFFQTWQQLA